MSQHFQSLRQTGQIKSDLARLSRELSTQQKDDLTQSLGGDTRALTSLDREISLVQSYQRATTQLGQRLAFAQVTLEIVDQRRGQFMEVALPIGPESTENAVADATQQGEATFREFVGQFNARFADQSLFNGARLDEAPLATADDMLASLRGVTAGLTEAADITNAINTWFDDPVGGFSTVGYLGDTDDPVVQRIGQGVSITEPLRANDQAVINLLKGAAIAAVVTPENTAVSSRTRSELVQEAGQRMLSAADDLTRSRGKVGQAEALVSEAQVTQTAQLTAFQINRNDLTVADPFETASRLQDVQQQLEMHYTVTARLSRLSLVNYLP